MRKAVKWGLSLIPVSLGLFFGLFFGVAYPEIVRSDWPLTRCDILNGGIDSRYCCESVCTGCSSAPAGAEQCSARISSINNGFNPTSCASNSTTCPTGVPGPCNGGYHCCRQCCETCERCTNTCTSSAPCTRTCTSYQCRCRCCDSVNRQHCTLQCPSCFTVRLDLTFYTGRARNQPHNTTYTQDFKKDETGAHSFFSAHTPGSKSTCYYNPKNLGEVSFDVSFTPWKWALVAIFGILPLFANLVFFAVLYGLLPLKDRVIEVLRQRRLRNQLRAVPQYDQSEGNSRIAILRDDDGKAYALEDRSAATKAFQAQVGSSQTRLYDDGSAPPEYSEVVSKEQKYADSGL